MINRQIVLSHNYTNVVWMSQTEHRHAKMDKDSGKDILETAFLPTISPRRRVRVRVSPLRLQTERYLSYQGLRITPRIHVPFCVPPWRIPQRLHWHCPQSLHLLQRNTWYHGDLQTTIGALLTHRTLPIYTNWLTFWPSSGATSLLCSRSSLEPSSIKLTSAVACWGEVGY